VYEQGSSSGTVPAASSQLSASYVDSGTNRQVGGKFRLRFLPSEAVDGRLFQQEGTACVPRRVPCAVQRSIVGHNASSQQWGWAHLWAGFSHLALRCFSLSVLLLRFHQALDKYRKLGGKLKCKDCVATAEAEEREAAAARRRAKEESTAAAASKNDDKDAAAEQEHEFRNCAACNKDLGRGSYNINQWNKGSGKSRCRDCVEAAVAAEKQEQDKLKEDKLAAARAKVEAVKAKGGGASDILKAESELAALEAEKVTGLKPVKMSGRGGGRGRGGRGRGRAGRS